MAAIYLAHPTVLMAVADALPASLVDPLRTDLAALLEFKPLRDALLSVTADHPHGLRLRARLKGFAFAARLLLVAGAQVSADMGEALWRATEPAYADAFIDVIRGHLLAFDEARTWATTAPENVVPPPMTYSAAPSSPSSRPARHPDSQEQTRDQPYAQPPVDYARPPAGPDPAIAALSAQVAWIASHMNVGHTRPSQGPIVVDSGAALREEDWRASWDSSQVRDLLSQLRARVTAVLSGQVGAVAAAAFIDTIAHVIHSAHTLSSDRDTLFDRLVWPAVRNTLAFTVVADEAVANAATIDHARFCTEAYADVHTLTPWSRDTLDRVLQARRKAAPRPRGWGTQPRRERASGGASDTAQATARDRSLSRGRRARGGGRGRGGTSPRGRGGRS